MANEINNKLGNLENVYSKEEEEEVFFPNFLKELETENNTENKTGKNTNREKTTAAIDNSPKNSANLIK